DVFLEGDLYGFIRDEMRLGGHHRPARAALGQLVAGSLPGVLVLDVGKHQEIHEPLDEGGLSGANRTPHSDIDAAAGAFGDVSEDVDALDVRQVPPARVSRHRIPAHDSRSIWTRGTGYDALWDAPGGPLARRTSRGARSWGPSP